MKGLVLSGGKGTRLRPFTYTGAKQLVPVANRPVLFYALDALVEAGITDIGIVVGDTAEQVQAAVGDGSRFGARVTYIHQPAPLGIAHAVLQARDFLQDERFVLFLGDNLVRDGIVPIVERFRHADINALMVLKEVPNPQDFGIALIEDGRVTRLIEKPKEPPTNLAVIGVYAFDHHVFKIIEGLRPSARGELEITDTLQGLLDQGYRVEHWYLSGPWTDTGKMGDLLEANRWMLEALPERREGRVDESSRLVGKVILEEDAEVQNSLIRGPAAIGARTRIVNSYIGPFTSIDHDCYIEGSEIEHAIVMEGTSIVQVVPRIEESLIGRFVRVGRSPERPRSLKLVLGDHSEIGLVV
jgi:glucose-1-phosphate thymidylyltransferase